MIPVLSCALLAEASRRPLDPAGPPAGPPARPGPAPGPTGELAGRALPPPGPTGELAGGALPGSTEALLEVVGASAGYVRARVLFGVSLDVPAGSAVAVVGPNGAGKTTLARLCSGLLRPTAGHVFYQGADIREAPPHRLARRGLVHVPEGRAVFAALTVEENLVLRLRQQLGRSGAKPALAQTYDRFPHLGRRRRQLAGSLSGGEQRILALAPVLVRPPRLLILDELTLGLDPGMVEEVQALLRSIAGSGSAMLLLEQRVARATAVADRVISLARGRVEDGMRTRPRDGGAGQVGEVGLPDR